jgi:Ca2+-dependent lipid-binding protein
VEISAIPMIDLGIRLNAMNLPLVSTFISNSINTAIYEYVAPKSLTVDLGQMLVGDDIKKDTDALGTVVVTSHRANVEAADFGGKSDPYVTVSYAKYGKPLFSTRIILGEREPVWKATAFCLVRPDACQVRERLALQIWDSDRFTADDELGRVEIDLYDLYRHRGKMKYHESGLKHIDRNKKDVDGELHFSIGYFPKVMPHEKSTKEAPKDKDMPSDFQDKEEMQANRPKTMDDQEDQIIAMSPSDEYPSGILSIQVHEAFDLERQVIAPSRGQKSKSTPFSHPSSADDATREEGDDLPSAYFRIRINDETTYQSRVKPIQSHPFFQAGQERFIRDWRTAVINIQVRDSRVRESDPLLGTVQLRLQDAFRSRSQLTKTYPIVGGIGYGRLRVSLLFRPVEMKIPRSLLGWETATVIVKQNIRVEVSDEDTRNKLSHCRISLRTAYGSKSLRHHPEKGDEGNAMTWKHRRSSLPVRKRFSSPLIITFKGNAIGLGSNIVAMGVLWLMCVEDNVRHQISLPSEF